MLGRGTVLLVWIFTALFVTGCAKSAQQYAVPDVSRPAVFTLAKSGSTRSTFALPIRGSGFIHGTAKIELLLNGSPCRSETLSGEVDFLWEGDWYSDDADIRYLPAPGTTGELTLRYCFKDR
jgi:hypothetical protein